jgi:hypothetical protein
MELSDRREFLESSLPAAGDVHARNAFANARAVEPRAETVTVKNDAPAFSFAPAAVAVRQLNLL